MENKTYDYQKPEDKYFFGAFFNLAHNNIQVFFTDFYYEIGKEVSNLEEIQKYKDFILSIFKVREEDSQKIWFVDYQRYVKRISDYFPMAIFLDDAQLSEKERIKTFATTLNDLLQTVENLRNFYTHYHHENISSPPKM